MVVLSRGIFIYNQRNICFLLKISYMLSVIIFLVVVYIGHTLNLTDTDIKFTDIKTKK